MKISDLISFLEEKAPLQYQEKYDNAGLIVGKASNDLSGVLVCLDSTEEVVAEAIEKGCNLIIAHHPIIFSGIKKLTGKTYIGRTIIKAIQNDIAIYAMHTNLDNLLENGVSYHIAKRLGASKIEILDPKGEFALQGLKVGTGVMATLENPMDEIDFLHMLKKNMQTPCVKYTKPLEKPVQNIAICGGSCAFLLKKAIAKNADVFITSDFKYHEYFDADGKILIADIGHYESEQFTIQLIYELITNNFSNFAAHFTKVHTNPINYL